MEHREYSLAKKGKSTCPECGQRTFVLYVDNATGKPLHPSCGKCDRADHCGFHYPPKQYFADNNIPFDNDGEHTPRPKPTPAPQPSYIDTDLMKKSLANYEQNHLTKWLTGVVGKTMAREAIGRYFVGTSKNDGTVFWQIDLQGRVRAGKIIVYGKDGHRRKDITPPVQWVHTTLKLPDFILSQCLFGEHLLTDKSKIVAIVEAEKTAVIASIYLPGMIWLACGGSEGLSADKCAVLRGRNVVLFPDCGKYEKWSIKAKELSKSSTVSVSSLVEEQATGQERESGFDIADYLTMFSLSDFVQQKLPNETPTIAIPPMQESPVYTPSMPSEATPIEQQPMQEQSKHSVAYVSNTGALYIPTPPDRSVTYSVYSSIEAYNKRSELPVFKPIQSVDISEMKQVWINLKTLTIE